MRYQMDSSDAGECESSAYVVLDRDPISNPAIFLDCSNLPSLTRQEFADECDVNKLMAQYEKTGILPSTTNQAARFLDVSDVPDLPTALNMLNEATTSFMSLPAAVRREFDNDPVKFIQAAQDPANEEKFKNWGLTVLPPVEAPPQKVEVINPTPPKPAPTA